MKRHPWLALLLVLVVGAVFSPVRDQRFVLLDDNVNVYANARLLPPSLERTAGFWREPYKWMYVPVTYSVWAAVAAVAEVDEAQRAPGAPAVSPRPFHLANLALHALTVLACFALLRKLVENDIAAALGAALFAVHPVQVEPVAWVSGLKDVLSGCLAMVALWQYVVLARAPGPTERTRFRGLRWAAATLALALALLAKPSAVVVPAIAAAIDYLVLRRPAARVAKWTCGWFALAAGAALLARAVQPATAAADLTVWWQRPFVAGDALAFYLRQLVLPLHLAPDYGRAPEHVFATAYGYAAWVVPALVLVALAAVWRLRSAATASFVVFTAGVLPVLGLIPFEFQIHSTVADRYLYLAMLGPAIFVAFVFRDRRPGTAHVAAAALLALAGARSYRQVHVWHDTETLLAHTLEVNPRSALAHTNLGEGLMNEGRVEEAIEHYRAAVRAQPRSAQALNNLGSTLGQSGRLDEALPVLAEAVRLDPDYAQAHMNLANTFLGLGRNAEAVVQLREVTRLEPDFAPPYFSLGQLLELQDDVDGALAAYEQLARIDPDNADAQVRRGLILARRNQISAAAEAFAAAVRADPRNAEAQGWLGMALVELGRNQEAYEHLETALQLQPDQPRLLPYLERARQGRAESR